MKNPFIRLSFFILFTLILVGCMSKFRKDGPPAHDVDVSKIADAVPHSLPKSHYGNPESYVVYGQRYHVLPSAEGYKNRGIASWYGTKFHGQLTASREPYDMLAMTGASRTLPIPSFVKVTNLENGRSAIVKINDRGPFAPNRIIDLSYVAAKKLGFAGRGTALVEVAAITPDMDHFAANPAPSLAANTPVAEKKNAPQLYLQLGAFSQLASAEALKNKLTSIVQKPVVIETQAEANRAPYKVRIGPFIGVGEIDRIKSFLEQRGFAHPLTIIN